MDEKMFIEAFKNMMAETNKCAVEHGFWDKDVETADGTKLMLMVSELAEAQDALRHGNPPDNHIPEFTGVEAELADLVIRTMDFCFQKNARLAEAIIAKHKYNINREYKHGKKF
jgi:NTP pyrophosphatase (non-canonical NTP hydrolase)